MSTTRILRSAVLVVFSAIFAVGLGWATAGEAGVELALLALGIQWVAFWPAWWFSTEKYYDLIGSFTYLSLLAYRWNLGAPSEAAPWITLMVGVWAVRLGTFLARRIQSDGEDRRFREIKLSFWRFLVAWSVQGLWVLWTSLAALTVMGMEEVSPLAFGAGATLWALGFAIEVMSDRQKSAFRARPENHGAFITTGLWARSRHPNYVGEILLWTGMACMGLGHYTGTQWVALTSPLFVFLLLRYGSGVPLLEASADERWGDDPAYQRYKAQTPILFPGPWSR